jgi:hypothetical protein
MTRRQAARSAGSGSVTLSSWFASRIAATRSSGVAGSVVTEMTLARVERRPSLRAHSARDRRYRGFCSPDRAPSASEKLPGIWLTTPSDRLRVHLIGEHPQLVGGSEPTEMVMAGKTTGAGESATRRAAQQDLALEALARGASYRNSGDLAGVTPKTVQRWMQDPSFSRRLADRRGARLSEVTGLLLDATTDAVAVIRRECLEAEKASDRLRAASLLLTMASRLRDRLDVETRLQEVEAFVGLTPPPANLTEAGES